MRPRCGYPAKDWHRAKQEVRAALIQRAKAKDVISFAELVRKVTAIQLDPDSLALSKLLREIAVAEHAAGRGMLSAVVVYSNGDMQPGPGFFNLAGRLRKNTYDSLRCWIKELKRVYGYWAKAKDNGKRKPHRHRSKHL